MEEKDHQEELDEKEPVKKREDLRPVYILLESGEEVEAFTRGDAATYMGLHEVSFSQMLARLKRQGKGITGYQMAYGGINRYYLKRDLDNLRRVKPVE